MYVCMYYTYALSMQLQPPYSIFVCMHTCMYYTYALAIQLKSPDPVFVYMNVYKVCKAQNVCTCVPTMSVSIIMIIHLLDVMNGHTHKLTCMIAHTQALYDYLLC